MSDNLQKFSAALPEEVTFTWNNPGTGFGDPSYLNLNINSGSTLDGLYDAWCVDTDRLLFGASKGKVFSSYEELPPELLGPGNIEKPENLDSVNWIINQGLVGTELFDETGNSLGIVTYGDVQRAIWEIIDDENTTGGLGPFSEERAQRIAELALTQGDGFVPEFGDKLAVIITPDTTDDGVFNPDRQFVIVEVELSKLGDFVFEDSNANGIQDGGENGIEGVTVNLLADIDGDGEIEAGEIVDSTTTDADGMYMFTVVAGDYKVEFEQPDGFEVSPANQGGDDTVDSDGLISDVINLDPGENDPTIDQGFYQTASLGDFVFEDDNANGIQDNGEAGIAGVEVKLLADLDNDGEIDDVVETDITAGDGSYAFTGLTPGVEYKVMFTQPDGFDGVSPFQAGNNTAVDSDADPNNGLMSDVVVLGSGENNPTIDAGFFKTAGLGDFVFLDDNRNGIQDAGEAGVEGVLVKLQNPDGSAVLDDAGNPITTMTDANGEYAFTGLTPGEYKVMFVAPDGFEFTTANAGGDDTVDSDADPTMNGMTQTVVLESGDFNDTLDAGLIQLIPSIDIEKFTNGVDADSPDEAPEILAGDTVTWTYEVTNTGEVDFDESEVVVTDDQEGVITEIIDKGDGDNLLEVGETWIYQKTGIAQDLSTVVNTVIDFETDGSGNPLPAGTVIDNEYQNLGLTISATGFGAMIFDSANPTGGDDDLATDSEGNILIISEDGDSSDPDDNAGGGVITFDLDNPVTVNSINFVDIEEAGGIVFTTDADGNVTTTAIPAPGNGSLQTLNINDSDVVKIEVDLVGSGAISGLDFDTISTGIYKNTGTVVAGDVTDEDHSHYINLPADPGIEIEKFVNGIDVTDLTNLPEIAAGSDVTFTYLVTNTGNIAFAANEIFVTDDNGTIGDGSDDFTPTLDVSTDQGSDGILSVGETWTYVSATQAAQDLTITTPEEHLTFVLTGNSSTTGNNGNIRTFMENGVSVDVSAFSSDKSGGNWRTAYLGAYGGGLGVTNRNESGSHHRVDNGGSNDYILFEFDKEVTVDRAFLDSISHDSDITVWIGDRNGDITHLNSQILNSFAKEYNSGGSGGSDNARWANINADELVGDTLVIAARDNDHDDAFKLKKLDISVPGETIVGNYINTAVVTADSVTDSDMSGYTNPALPSDPIKTTFHLTGNSPLDGPDGNVRTFSEDGLSVDVSAFSRGKDDLTGQWKDAYLGAYSGGLGVTDQSEGTHAHRVDNLGQNFNYVLFKFSKEVEVDRAYLDAVDYDADIKYWIGDTNATSLNDALLDSFYSEINETPGIGEYSPRWADINSGGLTGNTLIIAANPDEHTFEDSFKIGKLEVHHI
ncbi:MAG: SdrD B-like domain-containing protein [Crocosphaera sp.]|nr:SdrD B-like domain-containing protein [Crocosphaera sp.]